jgi:enoyl-CoA hydratase/carnithine racemase
VPRIAGGAAQGLIAGGKLMAELVEYEPDGRVVTIEINRAEKRNAISSAVTAQLAVALDRFDNDDTVEVAILCGRGPAFSSGADVTEVQMASREDRAKARDPLGRAHPFAELLHRCRNWKPVIASVHGYALGMALGLMLDCDLSVCEENCRLQVTEVNRGLGGFRHWALMQARGARMFADEVCLTGRAFTGTEAHAAGLVTRVVPAGQARAVALELARAIVANPPLGVRETVRVRRWHMHERARAIAMQTEHSRLELTEDFEEAVRAFAEKRPPGPFKAR